LATPALNGVEQITLGEVWILAKHVDGFFAMEIIDSQHRFEVPLHHTRRPSALISENVWLE
jgi:hypothetical protein